MIHVGKTARHLRKSLGLTQRAAARQLDISCVHLCNIENNKSVPSQALLERFRELWNVDLYVLAWCLYGDADKLPKPLRKPMAELARAWQEHIGAAAIRTHQNAPTSCSESDK